MVFVHTVQIAGEEFVVLSYAIEGPRQPSLTAAEQHVLELVLSGLGNAAIAAIRGVAPRTIANQIQSIFRKLGVASRAELAASLAART